MYQVDDSFIGEAKRNLQTRKLQLLLVHPKDWTLYNKYFGLEHCLSDDLTQLLNNVYYEISVYFQQKNAMQDFTYYYNNKDQNFVISFYALTQLIQLFDSPEWAKRKDVLMEKLSKK